MQPPRPTALHFDDLIKELLDPEWYQTRYPDIAAVGMDPLLHFTRFGAMERRNPNRFFDSDWYIEHYPDVAASGLNPLMHYLQAGAAEGRNPHPRFDAAYYVDQHPDAAADPLLYHIRTGLARGYLTEAPIDIRDYLPSEHAPLVPPQTARADVVITVRQGLEKIQRCISSVLADRSSALVRIIVIDDKSPDTKLSAWLQNLAAKGHIHLIRNRRPLGFLASCALGIEVTKSHDVVLLCGDSQVPLGWLQRLAAHAYAQPNVATVSPFTCYNGIADLAGTPKAVDTIDQIFQATNSGRFLEISVPAFHCLYVRRAVLDVEGFVARDGADGSFFLRSAAAGWKHWLACDMFVYRNGGSQPSDMPCSLPLTGKAAAAIPSVFAVTAALVRAAKLPVILMVTHNFGGGVRRHIDNLVERYRATARMLLLEGTDRGVALSVPSLPLHPALTLPSERLDDLIAILQSMNVSRVHIHHLLRMDIDIPTLIHRLGVPFDVTVHDYFAICPQINLLRWPEGLYCGEPDAAACNACIADQSSHGARDITSWRRGSAWQFMQAERVICPSADVKSRLDHYGLGERAIVVPHERQTATKWPISLAKRPIPPIRIALVGVLANHKGARSVAEVAEMADPGLIEIHLAGHLEDSFPKQAIRLVKATGKYRECDLGKILERIDPHVFWFPSSAPETYSYTLSTAICTGLPIVATDLGAFSERLSGRPLTWLVDHRASAQDWLKVFDEVRTTLRNPTEHRPMSRRMMSADFYADDYLLPPPKDRALATAARAEMKAAHKMRTRRPAASIHTRKTNDAKRLRIAIIPERYATGGLTPCAYIRLLQPLDHSSISGMFDVVLATAETVFHHDVDIIVTQRYAISNLETANRLADHARRAGMKLLFDLDDDLLSVPSTHADVLELRPIAKVVRRMLRIADAVWVSTPGLAKRLVSIRPDATIIENRLDERIWKFIPAPVACQDNPVRILCMGTRTHDRDFAMIEPALLRLKAEYGDRIAIDVLGMTSRSELPTGMNRIGPPTHGSRSYPGFVNWLTSMQPRWHIGLAPLLDTPFNSSKSPIKALDYAALGLAILASDTPVYRGSLADGPAGQLVANEPHAWHAALDWLIRNHNLRQTLARCGREAFLAQATLASHGHTRAKALADLLVAETTSACRTARPR